MIERVKNISLTSYQIKLIALIFMTIDHLGAYGFDIPIFAAHYSRLRQLGRIAAPLFLFMLIESARHTKSKPKFIGRLYIAGAFTGLFVTATNFFLGNLVGVFTSSNIIFTFFYTVLYIYAIEKFVNAIKQKKFKPILVSVLIIFATFIPNIFNQLIYSVIDVSQWQTNYKILLTDSVDSFLPVQLGVEYSLMLVIMGVLLYFATNRYLQYVIFSGFCLLCYVAVKLNCVDNLYPFSVFFGGRQYLMIMALPILLLYNGERGKEQKVFFYVYYPLHRYIISIVQTIITK